MAEQTQLTNDDLNLVARAAVLAAAVVAISKYSGTGGQDREFDTIQQDFSQAASGSVNPLVGALGSPNVRQQIAELKQRFQKDPKQSLYQEFKMSALNRCAQAAGVVDAKATPADAAEYRAVVMQVCQRVAEATNERGTPLDSNEAAIIGMVKRALGA